MDKSTLVFTLKVDKDVDVSKFPNSYLGEVLEDLQKILEKIFGDGNIYAELDETSEQEKG